MPDATDQLSQKLLDGIKSDLGNDWAAITAEDRLLIAECCTDAAALKIDALAFPNDAASQKILSDRAADITAQMANIASVGAGFAQTFWKNVIDVAIKAATTLAIAAL